MLDDADGFCAELGHDIEHAVATAGKVRPASCSGASRSVSLVGRRYP